MLSKATLATLHRLEAASRTSNPGEATYEYRKALINSGPDLLRALEAADLMAAEVEAIDCLTCTDGDQCDLHDALARYHAAAKALEGKP